MTTAPRFISVLDDIQPILGDVADQGFTNDTSPTIEVSLGDAAVGDQMQLLYAPSGQPFGPRVVLTENDLAAGVIAIPLSALAPGQYPLQVERLSAAGAVLAVGFDVRTFNAATAPPAAPFIQLVLDDSSGQRQLVQSGETADTTPLVQVFVPEVSGQGPLPPGHPPYGEINPVPGGLVLLYADGALIGQGVIGSAGSVLIDPAPLAPGSHNLTVATQDKAGNLSPLSAPAALTIEAPVAKSLDVTPALVAVGQAQGLARSAGWSDAAVLSSHALTIVGTAPGGYGSLVAAEQTYVDGQLVGTTTPRGYASAGETLQPTVDALPGDFYKIGYVGSSDYEIYGAAGQLAFVHNAYASPSAAFTPLTDGGYVLTDSSSNVFGLFDPVGANIGWLAMPANLSGGSTVTGLDNGGLVFTDAQGDYALFGPAGQAGAFGQLDATGSGFARSVAPTTDGGFAEVWLSPDGGQFGLATTIAVQTVDGAGRATSAALPVAQDLDPWHSQFQLQTHQDGSVAVLWSQGGGVFGAEFAAGAVGPAYGAVTGDLSQIQTTPLPDNQVGLAYEQGGEVWTEIFDPATGSVHRSDLGAVTGDISTVHILPTASGGVAVSWRDTHGVEGAVMSADGSVGAPVALPGDLLGIDPHGHAVTLQDSAGPPLLQTFALAGGGLFWVH